ncbi:hypothetical protein BRD56_06675 [Thermoplasmatales archaeon SW_10_69_26]|nr:MAG: hypothetical protein BRD56_06675 [Thermoplasmatales archaeon SW_10_69_26]
MSTEKASHGPLGADALEIRNTGMQEERDQKTVTGEVANNGDEDWDYVQVTAAFLDSDGNVVNAEKGYTDPENIPAGGQAGFEITSRHDPPETVTDYTLWVQADPLFN